MLGLTEDAAAAIRDMLAGFELPPGAGLRISTDLDESQEPGLHLAFQPQPEEGDRQVTAHGVCVFLDPAAAEALDDKVLDAHSHGDHAHFAVVDR